MEQTFINSALNLPLVFISVYSSFMSLFSAQSMQICSGTFHVKTMVCSLVLSSNIHLWCFLLKSGMIVEFLFPFL